MKTAPLNLYYIQIKRNSDVYINANKLINWLKDELIIQLTDAESQVLASDFIKTTIDRISVQANDMKNKLDLGIGNPHKD